MSRTMIDTEVLKENLCQRVFKGTENEYYRGAMEVIDEMAARGNLKYHCRDCLLFIERRKNSRGTLLGKCERKAKRPIGAREIYGSTVACIRIKLPDGKEEQGE